MERIPPASGSAAPPAAAEAGQGIVRRRAVWLVLLGGLIAVVVVALSVRSGGASAVSANQLTQFHLPDAGLATSITSGPDGNIWFTAVTFDPAHSSSQSEIGKLTRAGTITEYPFPTNSATGAIGDIMSGPDGALWFAEGMATAADGTQTGGQIGRITTDGRISGYPLPTVAVPMLGVAVRMVPVDITAGPDGALWFIECDSQGQGCEIGRITTIGQIAIFLLPTPYYRLESITNGPDGNLWFSAFHVDMSSHMGVASIGQITPYGRITEYPLPTGAGVSNLTSGPDGNVWFTMGEPAAGGARDEIGRITPSGQITAYPLPTGSAAVKGMTSGPAGAIWFIEWVTTSGFLLSPGSRVCQIGRMSRAGQVTEYSLPGKNVVPWDMTTGPDGALWFTYVNASGYEFPSDVIGRLALPGAPA